LKNDRLRWSFLKWRVDFENDVTSLWKTNSSNSSSQIDFVNCLFSFIQKRSARRMCVCVLVFMCLRRRRIQMKNVVFEKNKKNFSFVEFKDFCLLKSIFNLIMRSLVNIKRKGKSLLRWQNSKILIYICVTSYRKFTLLVVILVQISDYFVLF
jgi:hypothetical protein